MAARPRGAGRPDAHLRGDGAAAQSSPAQLFALPSRRQRYAADLAFRRRLLAPAGRSPVGLVGDGGIAAEHWLPTRGLLTRKGLGRDRPRPELRSPSGEHGSLAPALHDPAFGRKLL